MFVNFLFMFTLVYQQTDSLGIDNSSIWLARLMYVLTIFFIWYYYMFEIDQFTSSLAVSKVAGYSSVF